MTEVGAVARIEGMLRRWQWLALALFAIGYGAATAYRASRKLFWFDEIFTVQVAKLPDLRSIWAALSQGVDFNPPLFYFLTKAGVALAGPGHLGVRLPEIAGFGIFCLCLYRFVALRSTVLGGLVAMLFPLLTGAYAYAYEARPHAVVLGCLGVALVCWQQAATPQGRARWPWLLGLALALACGLLNHAYAVLLFVPFIFGEAVRLWTTRKPDWPMAWALLVGAAAFAVLIPLARLASTTGIARAKAFDFSIQLLLNTYRMLLGPAVIELAVAAVAAFIVFGLARPMQPVQTPGVSTTPPGPARHELAALCALLLIPLFAAVLSMLTRAVPYDRYSLGLVAGCAALLGLLAGSNFKLGAALLAAMLVQIGVDNLGFVGRSAMPEPATQIPLSTHQPYFMRRYTQLNLLPDHQAPIVMLDELEFAPMLHYAPEGLAARLTYVIWDPGDTNGQGYQRLQRCCQAAGRVAPAAELLARYPFFYVYGTPRSAQRMGYLTVGGNKIEVLEMSPSHFLVSVTAVPAAVGPTPAHNGALLTR